MMKNKYIKELDMIHADDSFKEKMIVKLSHQKQNSLSLSTLCMKTALACVCVCLIIITVFSINIYNELKHTNQILNKIQFNRMRINNYVTRNDKPDPVESLLGALSIGGLGSGAIVVDSIDDLQINHISTAPSQLPIYINQNKRSVTGEPLNLKPLSVRKGILEEYLERFKINAGTISESSYDLMVEEESMEFTLQENDRILVWFSKNYIRENTFTILSEKKDEIIQNVENLVVERREWFDDSDYEIQVSSSYDANYEIDWDVEIVFENETIELNVNEEGILDGIVYNLFEEKQIYKMYPVISIEKAKEQLSKGMYYSFDSSGNIHNIVGIEIAYVGDDEYILPYYKIYMTELEQSKIIEFKGLKSYVSAYVPAIDADVSATDGIYYPNQQ